MKTKMLIAAGALAMLMTGCEPCKSASTEKTSLVTEKDKYSYALGAHFGNQARFQLVTRDSIDLDLDLFIQAFKERYNSDSAKFLMNCSLLNLQEPAREWNPAQRFLGPKFELPS